MRLEDAPNSRIVSTGKKAVDTDGYNIGSPHPSALERMRFDTFQSHGTTHGITHEQNELMAAQHAARAFADSREAGSCCVGLTVWAKRTLRSL